MTPTQKAKELVDKYKKALRPDNRSWEIEAKQCALIAVDEILANGFNPQLPFEYWQQVKTEIKKL